MHGRILIADDRFASRLMLSALFGGAYYDVMQVDTCDTVVAAVKRDRPGIVVISDGLSGIGAAGLCEALRSDPDTADAARIVMTDMWDPARTAMLIHSGAEEVIPRSCRDEEVLARVRTLVDHRARISALNLRDDTPRTQPGLSEATEAFVDEGRITIVSGPRSDAQDWKAAIVDRHQDSAPPRIDIQHPEDISKEGHDVLVIDGRALGPHRTLRLVARIARQAQPRATQILVAVGPEDRELGLKALDLGADSLLRLPFNAEEAAARIALLLHRKSQIKQLHDRLRSGLRSALTDPLTGLYNRRYALPRLDQMIRDMRADSRPAAVIMTDLDHFKWINDSYGHPAGDAVLCSVARTMQAEADSMGFAARMGGEEFLVALPDCNRLIAASVARRLCNAVSKTRVAYPGVPDGLRVTISVGVAVAEPDCPVSDTGASEATATLLTRADRALYRAKRAGRNRVVCDMGLVCGTAEPLPQKVSGLDG